MDLQLLNQAVNTREQCNSLAVLDKTMLPEEKKILSLKYSGKRFSQMTPMEVQTSAKEVLLRIHVIAGWVLPPDELMMILVDEFQKKVLESYGDVTADEITHAFRTEGYKVKEWGKALNISLIDEVIMPYLEKRYELSKIEERHSNVLLIENKPDPKEIDKEFEAFKNNPDNLKYFPK